MSKTYMVAVDGSDHGWKALDLATDLANSSDAELIIAHVIHAMPVPDGLSQIAKAEGVPLEEEVARYYEGRALSDKIVIDAEARVRKTGFTRVVTRVAEGHAANQIVDLAKIEKVDMIFLGSRGLSDVKSLLMGGVSHKVMNLAPCTCVAVK